MGLLMGPANTPQTLGLDHMVVTSVLTCSCGPHGRYFHADMQLRLPSHGRYFHADMQLRLPSLLLGPPSRRLLRTQHQ